jgi:orotidine-5'-phosphate decarboxylase
MNRLCLALDTTEDATVESLVRVTQPYVGAFKVGATTFAALGPSVVGRLAACKPVFCDLKFNDIPAQVHGAMGVLSELGAAYATVHALGGRDMIRAAAGAASNGMKLLAVTVLTSLAEGDLRTVGIQGSIDETVMRLAAMALDAGADGIVCSGNEISMLRERFGRQSAGGPFIVVPGIRAEDEAQIDDQQRRFGPRAAIDAGADLIVVGRPITGSHDPGAAASALSRQLSA